ncbi:glutathione S-transferase U17 [Cinnamomum micranthum f. kanehirae]|uniref:Glutathione S-transferase n=1 Tax=Cinnamomum micranthum f. kanehirae TaxID=337451 RepID=A0A3S3MRY3_9MAGN|nr:glutathione S-transferase U17 [Cinnamomum micranthum f. kanehirae]
MGEVKVLGAWPSPFVMRARIALNLKSADYEFIQETMNPKSQLLLESNPVYKKIPVLLHNQRPVCESMIIVQYIDDAWPTGPSILPSDPYDRAIARFWAAYIDDKWFPSLSTIARAQGEEARVEAIKQVISGIQLLEEAFEKCSKGKSFFSGDSIGLLDIALGCFLGWIKTTEKMAGVKILDPETVPHLVGWAERFCADSAVKEVMPETEKLIAFAKAKFQPPSK